MKIGIRVDCNSKSGLGHFNRTSILAKILSYSHEVIFISLDNLDLKKNFKLIKLLDNKVSTLVNLVSNLKLEILIIDNYDLIHKNLDFKKLFNIGIVLFDDFGFDLKSDLIIRQNIFDKIKSKKILSGTDFILSNNLLKKNSKLNSKIFEFTFYISEYIGKKKIIECFLKKNKVKKIAIISNYKKAPFSIEKKYDVSFFGRVQPEKVFEVLDKSEVLITPASTISFEGYLNNNKIILYQESDDQKKIYESSPDNDSILKIGNFNNLKNKQIEYFLKSEKKDVQCPTFDLVKSNYLKCFEKF